MEGGADLSPYYLEESDGRYFHQTLKEACDPFGAELYPMYKENCDRFLSIPIVQTSQGESEEFFMITCVLMRRGRLKIFLPFQKLVAMLFLRLIFPW